MNAKAKELMAELVSRAKAAREARAQKAQKAQTEPAPGPEPVVGRRSFEQLGPRLIKEADGEYDMFCASGFYLDNDRIYDTAEDSDNFVFCIEHEDGDDGDDRYLYPDKDGNVWHEIEEDSDQLEWVGRWKTGGTAQRPSEPPLTAPRLDDRVGRVEVETCVREDCLPELVNFTSAYSRRLEESRFYRERRHPEHYLHGDDEGRAVFIDSVTGFALYSDVYGNVWRPIAPGTYVCEGHWN